MKTDRTSLLVRCTKEESKLIREAAKRERCTLSGYILNAVLQRIATRPNMLRNTPEELKRKFTP